MSRLPRHGWALSAKAWSTTHSQTLDVTISSAMGQGSLASLACALMIQSRFVHARTAAALPAAVSMHPDANKERQFASSSPASDRRPHNSPLRASSRQLHEFHTSVAAAAASPPSDTKTTRHSTPPSHKGGPQPSVAAKESWPKQYRVSGRIEGPYSTPRKPVFAVIELGATQYKVSPGDLVVTEKLRHVDVNDRINIQRVMMLGSRFETIIGRPLVPGAFVTAAIEEQFQDAKVLIFKKRRRKNSRRLKGHRQDLTSVRIIDVEGIEAEPSLESPGVTAAGQEARAA